MSVAHLIPKCILKTHRKSSFNQREREAIRLYLIIRDGNKCNICGKAPIEGEVLDIDHIDANKHNPFHTNLQLAHHDCNCRKNKKSSKKGVDICVCVGEEKTPPASSGELSVKLIYYPAFIDYIKRKFITEGVKIIDIEDMGKNLFFTVGASPTTITRYAKDLCGSETPFHWYKDNVTGNKYLTVKVDAELIEIFKQKQL